MPGIKPPRSAGWSCRRPASTRRSTRKSATVCYFNGRVTDIPNTDLGS